MIFKRAMPTIIIDCHSILHTLRYAGRKFYTGGKDYQLISQFFQSLDHLSLTLYSNLFLFVWDSPVNKRKQEYSWYKQGRDIKTDTELDKEYLDHCFEQFRILRDDILPGMGYQCFMEEGYEADDVIASIVMNNKDNYIFVTTDADMYQLLPYARVYDFKHKQILNAEWFEQTCHFPAGDWWKVKMIAGCSTDTVPGVVGVGEKTAIQYLNGTLGEKTKKYQSIKEASPEMLERNEKLVRLPLYGCPIIRPAVVSAPSFAMFQHFCYKYSLYRFQSHANLQNIRNNLGMR